MKTGPLTILLILIARRRWCSSQHNLYSKFQATKGGSPTTFGFLPPLWTAYRMTSAVVILLTLIAFGCRGTKPIDDSKPLSSTGLPPGEVEVDIPCSGPEFYTDELVFRANSVGISNDLAVSKRKAMSNARADLAAAIEVTVGTVTDSYVKSVGGTNNEALSQRFESLTREVVTQRLSGLRTLCERYFLTEAGRYKTYVAIELSAQQLAESYQQRIQADSTLRGDFDYEKFKAVFEDEMAKMGKN